MKTTRFLALASTAALALLAGLGAQLASRAATSRERPPTAVAHQRGTAVVVTRTADSGPGTLRRALLDAQPGDTITFDHAVFPPGNPATITVESPLPGVFTDQLVLSGVGAGVIIDGSQLPTDQHITAIEIIGAVSVTVEGLEVAHFPGAGIGLPNCTDSVVQNNILRENGIGASVGDPGASQDVIRDNEIYSNTVGVDVSWGAHNVSVIANSIYSNTDIGVGVVMEGSSARISQNSIHDNGVGILVERGGNNDQPAPLITGFNLSRGTVEGVTCARCTVEIFSDEDDEGEYYEGSTVADRAGYFVFSRGSPFRGPHLTATATHDVFNTSSFSRPTSGDRLAVDLQDGNTNSKRTIPTRLASELDENYMGDQPGDLPRLLGGSMSQAEQFIERQERIGLKWARLSIDVMGWHPVAEDPRWYSKKEVDPVSDYAITELSNRGFTILYCLCFWDDQIDPDQPLGWSRFKDEEEIERFLDYARFIVEHFRGRIEHYEIFNESFYGEDSEFSQQNIALEDYINVVHRVTSVIKDADPNAEVIAGPAPAVYDRACYDYQLGIHSSDLIMPVVDGVSWHPGPYPVELGLGDGAVDYLYRVPETVNELTSTAEASGFTGRYIPEELIWPSTENPPDVSEPWNIYSETVSAKYFGRGILDHRGRGMTAMMAGTGGEGPPKWDVVRNLGNLLAGAEPSPLTIQIQSTLTDVVSYTFAYAGSDDRLVAMWENGFASNAIEPGTSLTLTVSGLTQTADISVTGYDVLHSFRQPMEAYSDGDTLILPNLQVRDYPLILRLAPIRRVFLPVVLRQ